MSQVFLHLPVYLSDMQYALSAGGLHSEKHLREVSTWAIPHLVGVYLRLPEMASDFINKIFYMEQNISWR